MLLQLAMPEQMMTTDDEMPPSTRRPKVLAVTSGKGGAGKTLVSLHVAAELARLGHQVLLLDGDLGLANLHVLLGLKPKADLSSFIEGKVSLAEVCIPGPNGMTLLPGANGIAALADLDRTAVMRLAGALGELQPEPDYLIIDTGAGIGDQVTSLARLADDVIVVVRDEPASLADAYAVIKVLHLDQRMERFHVIVNDLDSGRRAATVFDRLNAVATRFIGVPLNNLGWIPRDPAIAPAARSKKLVTETAPEAPASRALVAVARRIDELPPAPGEQAGTRFLMDRLLRSRSVP
jgi:flagellar biosynthesis protein FlhG